METLWNPWRYEYITGTDAAEGRGCVFCSISSNSDSDEESFVLKRAEFNFVVLNIFPYSTGHLMIVPYQHLAMLGQMEKAATDEMMDLVLRAESALAEAYSPDGFNVGMNLGKAAGAGIANHLHMHVLPRWIGDVNFMTAIAATRTIPEDLRTTYSKLKTKF